MASRMVGAVDRHGVQLHVLGHALALQLAHDPDRHGVALLRSDVVDRRLPDELLGVDPQQRLRRRAHIDEPPHLIQDCHKVRRMLHERLEPRFVLAERLVGGPALTDVTGVDGDPTDVRIAAPVGDVDLEPLERA